MKNPLPQPKECKRFSIDPESLGCFSGKMKTNKTVRMIKFKGEECRRAGNVSCWCWVIWIRFSYRGVCFWVFVEGL